MKHKKNRIKLILENFMIMPDYAKLSMPFFIQLQALSALMRINLK